MDIFLNDVRHAANATNPRALIPASATRPIVNQPTTTEGIASNTSGSVITQGDSCGACARWPGA